MDEESGIIGMLVGRQVDIDVIVMTFWSVIGGFVSVSYVHVCV